MRGALLALAVFITLHEAGGGEIEVNPEFVVALRTTTEGAGGDRNKLVAPGTNCVLALGSGKFISVTETCEVVFHMIRRSK
jgi:hypothetical protein